MSLYIHEIFAACYRESEGVDLGARVLHTPSRRRETQQIQGFRGATRIAVYGIRERQAPYILINDLHLVGLRGSAQNLL